MPLHVRLRRSCTQPSILHTSTVRAAVPCNHILARRSTPARRSHTRACRIPDPRCAARKGQSFSRSGSLGRSHERSDCVASTGVAKASEISRALSCLEPTDTGTDHVSALPVERENAPAVSGGRYIMRCGMWCRSHRDYLKDASDKCACRGRPPVSLPPSRALRVTRHGRETWSGVSCGRGIFSRATGCASVSR